MSAFNPIEHAWSPLSNALTGVILPAIIPGKEPPPNKQKLTAEQQREKEATMLDNASTMLVTYWKHLRYDGNAVVPIPIESNGTGHYKDHDLMETFMNAPLRKLYADKS